MGVSEIKHSQPNQQYTLRDKVVNSEDICPSWCEEYHLGIFVLCKRKEQGRVRQIQDLPMGQHITIQFLPMMRSRTIPVQERQARLRRILPLVEAEVVGVDVSLGPHKILALTQHTMILDANSNATANITVSTPDPEFVAMANL